MNHGEIVSFLWGIADLIRDTFRRGHYQDVILPLTVLRRLECVLAPKLRSPHRGAELDRIGRFYLDGRPAPGARRLVHAVARLGFGTGGRPRMN
jgi:hypothetical protein